MKWEKGEFWITDGNEAADIDFVWQSLDTTYWAKGRSRDVVEKSVRNSVMLSLFKNDQSVGFTRIVGDNSTFAWICDVYVHPNFQGRGLGKWMMECCLAHPICKVHIKLLATRDAHGLYEKYGFVRKECMIRHGDRE